MAMITNKVGIIGGGNMARAIGGGLLRGGMHATKLFVAEPRADQSDVLRTELFGAKVTDDNAAVAAEADVLLFAVKPQILRSVCEALQPTVSSRRPLIMSIAAGPRIDDIERWLGGDLSIVRVMPNQPALIDQGVSALSANARADATQRSVAEDIMTAVGRVVWVDNEKDIDAVTAVSGTGPAYFYLLIDVMIEAATQFGLSAETARELAVETARGATALAAAVTESMAKMIERVRSPGGTTTAAFEVLEGADVRAIFARAIHSARDRARQLAAEAASG